MSKDQIGTILSWMQDRESPVFVVATANDVRTLPPELLRKGRFDQLFWCDLPTMTEREEILRVSLKGCKHLGEIDIPSIVVKTEGWVGAEIASIVPEAMFAAFNDGERNVETADLMLACGSVVPLSKTMGVKLEEIRRFMEGKAVNASYPEAALTSTATPGTVIDLE